MTLTQLLLAGVIFVQVNPAQEAMKIAEIGGTAIGFAMSCDFPEKDIKKLSNAMGKGIESLNLTDDEKLAAMNMFAERVVQGKLGNAGQALASCEEVKRIFYNFPAMKAP